MNSNSEKEFEKFFKENQNLIYRIVMGYPIQQEDARDIVIETFFLIYERWKRVSLMENPVGYTLKIAINLTKKKYLKNRMKNFIFFLDRRDGDEIDPLGENLDELICKKEKNNWLKKEIENLKNIEREVLILRDVEDLKFEEISKILSINISTAKSHYRRAKLKLLKKWEEQNGKEAL